MSGGEKHGARGAARRVTYCVIPLDLAGALHDPLRSHFRDDSGVEVIVEARRCERRSGTGRRATDLSPAAAGEDAPPGGNAPPIGEERRKVRSKGGRRVGERRAVLVTVPSDVAPVLPRRARGHADRIAFLARLEPATADVEDLDAARAVIRFQAGEAGAFHGLYLRYFDRVYSYFRVLLRDAHAAEDATQDVFEILMSALRHYERTDRPFRAWLFTVVRNHAIRVLRRSSRVQVVDSSSLDEYLERPSPGEEVRALSWITDQDLMILVERLPPDQRQVLAMRYVLDLKPQEIAEILGMTPNHVSVLHYRAINFLRHRLEGLGRRAERRGGRVRMRAFPKQAQILRRRRFVLSP